ncbi:MAG: prenyltransferase [Bacteroidota bacterium]
MSKFKVWAAQVRANFLILAVLLVAIGLAFAYKYKMPGEDFNVAHALLLLIGIVSAHISVNLFNEYSDYRSKIDFHTKPTPFSGGSGMLIKGYTKPGPVLGAAIGTILLSFGIGLYFTFVSHWLVLLYSVIGGLTILLYTDFLAKILMGELFAGLALGTLVVLGTFVAMNASPGDKLGNIIPLEVIIISIPPGILTSLLLFINEFPDMEADKKGGRYHLVIKLGKKVSSYVYTAGLFVTFTIIIAAPLLGFGSFWLWIALLPLPMAINASITALKFYHDTPKLIPALGSNVITVLATDLLLAMAVVIEIV